MRAPMRVPRTTAPATAPTAARTGTWYEWKWATGCAK